MNNTQFNTIINQQLLKASELLTQKGKEYAPDADRLIAFKMAAGLQQCSVPEALGGMLAKHIVSIYQMLPDASLYTAEKWDEKINDAINYLLLLKACIVEEDGKI